MTRGRMSSFGLLVQCRKLCALQLATAARFIWRWIPSESNPADAGSRLWEKTTAMQKTGKQHG
eukprot:3970141-Amphidinium_carterae.1